MCYCVGGLHFLPIKHPQMFTDPDNLCLPACFSSPSILTLPLCSSPGGARNVPPCGCPNQSAFPSTAIRPLPVSVSSLMWLSIYCLLWLRNLSFIRTWLPKAAGFPCCFWRAPIGLPWCNHRSPYVIHAGLTARQGISKHFSTPQLANLQFQGLLGWNQEILWSFR